MAGAWRVATVASDRSSLWSTFNVHGCCKYCAVSSSSNSSSGNARAPQVIRAYLQASATLQSSSGHQRGGCVITGAHLNMQVCMVHTRSKLIGPQQAASAPGISGGNSSLCQALGPALSDRP